MFNFRDSLCSHSCELAAFSWDGVFWILAGGSTGYSSLFHNNGMPAIAACCQHPLASLPKSICANDHLGCQQWLRFGTSCNWPESHGGHHGYGSFPVGVSMLGLR